MRLAPTYRARAVPGSGSARFSLLCAFIAPWLSVFCAVATSRAGDRRTIEKDLNRTYDQSEVILRGFPSGDSLVYDNSGSMISGGNEGPWTTDASVRISRIRLARDRIDITGDRIYVAYRGRQKGFEKLKGERLRIRVNLANEPANVEEASRPLTKLFLGPGEKLEDNVPPYWRPFLKHQMPPAADTFKKPGDRSPNPGNQIIAPVPVHNPDPPYTEEARRARYSGTVVLSLVVDKNGFVRDVIIVTPIGLGLDEQAVLAVRTWRFRPAKRNGQPVSARLMMEVTFRLV